MILIPNLPWNFSCVWRSLFWEALLKSRPPPNRFHKLTPLITMHSTLCTLWYVPFAFEAFAAAAECGTGTTAAEKHRCRHL